MSNVTTVLIAVVGVVTSVIFLWILVVTARRVLGAPTGWFRTVVIMVVTMLAGSPVLYALARGTGALGDRGTVDDPATAVILVLGAAAITFGLALIALVISELLVPSDRDVLGLRSPMAARDTFRQTGRILRISVIFIRRGIGRMVLTAVGTATSAERRRTAHQLRLALEECGATFVKFGQMLSTRPELLPAEVIDELAGLHADVAPEPYERIREVLEEEGIGADAFASFEEAPLAAASVGQVHRATLADGTDVVVKVQRPGARRQVEDDTAVLRRLVTGLAAASSWVRDLGMVALVDGFAASLAEELDYRVEAANLAGVAARLGAANPVRVPSLVSGLSTGRVLILERVDGTPISSAADRLAALSADRRSELSAGLFAEVLHEVLITGLFHADLHPGNVLLTVDNRLAMLDFGAVGRLDSRSRTAIAMLLFTLRTGDAAAATDALFLLLDRPEGVDDRTVEREVGALLLRVSEGGVSGLYGQLMEFALHHGFAIPGQVAAVFRTLSSVEGTLKLIDPAFDVFDSAESAGQDLIRKEKADEPLEEQLSRRIVPLLPVLEQLPRRIDRLLERAETGRLELGLRPFADEADRRFLGSLVNQAVVTVLAATTLIGGVWLLTSGPGPKLTATVGAWSVLGGAMLFVGVMLSLRALAQVFIRR